MSTQEILQQIARLSPSEKLFVVEKIISDLRSSTTKRQMEFAATMLEHDYRTDEDLIAFS